MEHTTQNQESSVKWPFTYLLLVGAYFLSNYEKVRVLLYCHKAFKANWKRSSIWTCISSNHAVKLMQPMKTFKIPNFKTKTH